MPWPGTEPSDSMSQDFIYQLPTETNSKLYQGPTMSLLVVNYLCSIVDFLNASDQGVEPESQIILF